jgi:hypothetical protein
MCLGKTSWRQENVEEAVHLTVDRKQRERKGPGTRYILQSHASSDLFPPAKLYLPKSLPLSKIAPPTED